MNNMFKLLASFIFGTLLFWNFEVVVCSNKTTLDMAILQQRITGASSPIIQPRVMGEVMSDTVTVSFFPVSIVGLDEETQVFSFSGALFATWSTPAAAWDPSEVDGNPNVVEIAKSHSWVPDLRVSNGVGDLSITGMDSVIVSSDGTRNYLFMDTFKASCSMDATHFPFDEHKCNVLLLPFGIFNLISDSSQIEVPEYFTESNEWKMENVIAVNRSYYQTVMGGRRQVNGVALIFHLKRYSGFYVITIIFPIALLSVLNASVFILPIQSGEKMSYLVSIFVSYALFLNFIYDIMPKSAVVSRLTIYLVLVLSQSGLSIVITIFILKMHFNSQSKVEEHRSWYSFLCCRANTPKTTKVHDISTPTDTRHTVWADLSFIAKFELLLFVLFLVFAFGSLIVFYV